MRCQFAASLIGLRFLDRVECIGAEYNLANDDAHLKVNNLQPGDGRVIHYLRESEFQRMTFLDPDRIEETIAKRYENGVSQIVASLAAEFAGEMAEGRA